MVQRAFELFDLLLAEGQNLLLSLARLLAEELTLLLREGGSAGLVQIIQHLLRRLPEAKVLSRLAHLLVPLVQRTLHSLQLHHTHVLFLTLN